jgi:polyhydroxyalkanoate synthesis regulator phasin
MGKNREDIWGIEAERIKADAEISLNAANPKTKGVVADFAFEEEIQEDSLTENKIDIESDFIDFEDPVDKFLTDIVKLAKDIKPAKLGDFKDKVKQRVENFISESTNNLQPLNETDEESLKEGVDKLMEEVLKNPKQAQSKGEKIVEAVRNFVKPLFVKLGIMESDISKVDKLLDNMQKRLTNEQDSFIGQGK